MTRRIDLLGATWGNFEFLAYYFLQDSTRPDSIDTDIMGLTNAIFGNIEVQAYPIFMEYIDVLVRGKITSAEEGSFSFRASRPYGVSCEDICFSLGGGSVRFDVTVTGYWDEYMDNDCRYVYYVWQADGVCKYSDQFRDAVDVFNLIKKDTYVNLGSFSVGIIGNAGIGINVPGNWEFPFGRPYGYQHSTDYSKWRDGVIKRPE